MIDNLLKADTEEALAALVGQIVPVAPNPAPLWTPEVPASTSNMDDGEGNITEVTDPAVPAHWRGDIAFPCQVFDATGTPLPYFYLWVMTSDQDENLMASDACVLVADREAWRAKQPFILKTALAEDQLNSYSISPVVIDTNYPFGILP